MPNPLSDNRKPHLLVVEARFYPEISDLLLKGALKEMERVGASYELVTVPGALEIPVVIQMANGRKDGGQRFDGYVALGCVIRGETSHYDIVCTESAAGIARLALKHSMAIGNGILTCDTEEQAIARASESSYDGGKGAAAVQATLSVLKVKAQFKV